MKPQPTENKVIDLTDDNFKKEVLEANVPVLVDFWAPWCGPCRAIKPIIESLADEYSGRVKIGTLNVDDHQQSSMEHKITGIPAVLIFKDGKVDTMIVGARAKPDYESALDSVLNN